MLGCTDVLLWNSSLEKHARQPMARSWSPTVLRLETKELWGGQPTFTSRNRLASEQPPKLFLEALSTHIWICHVVCCIQVILSYKEIHRLWWAKPMTGFPARRSQLRPRLTGCDELTWTACGPSRSCLTAVLGAGKSEGDVVEKPN